MYKEAKAALLNCYIVLEKSYIIHILGAGCGGKKVPELRLFC